MGITTSTRLLAVLTACALVAPACTPSDDAEADGEVGAEAGIRPADQLGRPLPDTTAASVWAYLQRVDYDDTWELWPGLGELYGGSEPHGLFLTTYVNAVAFAAADAYAAEMPANAIIVKEAYLPSRELESVTVMYKAAGFNPLHSDWFFAAYGPEGAVETGGRVESCQECHAEGPDYIMTAGFGAAEN